MVGLKMFVVCFLFLSIIRLSSYQQNVVLFLADDLGLESNVYGSLCMTPNLLELAERSTIYKNAYTTVSSCSPSRASLLTGLPSHQNGMYGLSHRENHFSSFDRISSISRILKKKKIYTGIIGKKHVSPEQVFPFDFSYTEKNEPLIQVGRNITRINELVKQFLSNISFRSSIDNTTRIRQFFLYIAFHDPHRCAHTHPEYGTFCENFGSGKQGMGTIPDWKPTTYSIKEVEVPLFLPDTNDIRKEISAQYTAIDRLDQGVGLILKTLSSYNLMSSTYIIFTSDNGPPFPNARTNVYNPGIRIPLMIFDPLFPNKKIFDDPVTLLDIFPTIMDCFSINALDYSNNKISYTGTSLLRFSRRTNKKFLHAHKLNSLNKTIFGSHNLHEVTMYYPMRYIIQTPYKLIHNLNYQAAFPIDQDLYISNSFQALLKGESWIKNLTSYYYRSEFEFYNIINDPLEIKNLVKHPDYIHHVKGLYQNLIKWQNETNDPWICSPHGVLENTGKYKHNPVCLPLYNEI